MKILLTNDDGIRSLGIKTIYRSLTQRGHKVKVVAPMRQNSGVSQCLTIFEPLRTQAYQEEDYQGLGVYGTPTDCVKLGLGAILPKKPELVVSGINLGANVGADLFYSGTVAAALEAAKAKVPSVAISLDSHSATSCLEQAAHATDLLEKINWAELPSQSVINLNYPNLPLAQCQGLKICTPCPAVWENVYQKRQDPRGQDYFWLIGDMKEEDILPLSDKALLREGYITLSSLRQSFDDPNGQSFLKKQVL